MRLRLRIGRRSRGKRRRRAFSLNGLAIQLSAFALSFTLVAVLVVSGSHAAFVEENETVTQFQKHAQAWRSATPDPAGPPAARPSSAPSATPTAPVTAPPPEPAAPSIELADNDAGTAMFGPDTVLSPGHAVDRCISVTYAGDTDSPSVVLYAATAYGELAPYLQLTVDGGRNGEGDFGDCSGFEPAASVYDGTLAAFAADHSAYDSGVLAWQPEATGENRSFRFRLTLSERAGAGASATFGFTWESRAS